MALPQAFTKMRRPVSAILPHPVPAASAETSLASRGSLSAIALVVMRLLVVVASRIKVRITSIALTVVSTMTNTVGAAQTLLPVLAILTVVVVLPGDVAN